MNKIMAFSIMVFMTMQAEYKPMNVAAMQEFHAGNERNLKLLASMVSAAAGQAGAVAYTVGYETAYGALAGAGTALKSGAIVAAPWVAGGAVVGYGGYKTYRYFNPTPEERVARLEKEFTSCLTENIRGTLNKHGFPDECSDVALSFALLAGSDHAKGMIDAFKDFSTAN